MMDCCTKYHSEFDAYLTCLGVQDRMIATMNPRANGQIGWYNCTIEAGLRKFVLECPGGSWWEFLPDLVRGLHLLPVHAIRF